MLRLNKSLYDTEIKTIFNLWHLSGFSISWRFNIDLIADDIKLKEY